MRFDIKYFIGVLKKDMVEWNHNDYGLHALIAKHEIAIKVSLMYVDGKISDVEPGYVIMEPVYNNDLPLFRKTVLEWAKKWWYVDESVTETQFFGNNHEDYCEFWFFGLEERFFESLKEIQVMNR